MIFVVARKLKFKDLIDVRVMVSVIGTTGLVAVAHGRVCFSVHVGPTGHGE